jgi:hypothetical protein
MLYREDLCQQPSSIRLDYTTSQEPILHSVDICLCKILGSGHRPSQRLPRKLRHHKGLLLSRIASILSILTAPGDTQLTRIGASSIASARANPSRATQYAEFAARPA